MPRQCEDSAGGDTGRGLKCANRRGGRAKGISGGGGRIATSRARPDRGPAQWPGGWPGGSGRRRARVADPCVPLTTDRARRPTRPRFGGRRGSPSAKRSRRPPVSVRPARGPVRRCSPLPWPGCSAPFPSPGPRRAGCRRQSTGPAPNRPGHGGQPSGWRDRARGHGSVHQRPGPARIPLSGLNTGPAAAGFPPGDLTCWSDGPFSPTPRPCGPSQRRRS